MEATVDYTIYAKSVEEAIDMKNKILANTIDKEKITITVIINEAYVIC